MNQGQTMSYHSNGKLLLSGEYLVLKGATALSIPTKFGQSLVFAPIEETHFLWQSFDHLNRIWLEVIFDPSSLKIRSFNGDQEAATRLRDLLRIAFDLSDRNPSDLIGSSVSTLLEFDKNWGLGTSSTLINNVADWLDIDPYLLLQRTFGGSGYDIACARNNSALLYTLEQSVPTIEKVSFKPSFSNHMYFVYLNQKQISRDSILKFEKQSTVSENQIRRVSEISRRLVVANNLTEFSNSIVEHESILSDVLMVPPVKKRLFNDFDGEIKSLGAWGGDFVLALSSSDPSAYFRNKGYETIIAYDEMVL